MAKVQLPYSAGNNLSQFIIDEQTKRSTPEAKVRLSDIEEELAEYCSITSNSIKAIKNQKSSTSLPVALRIAEFFGTDVGAMFPLLDSPTNTAPVARRMGVKREAKRCEIPNCEGIHYSKGMCKSHYHEQYDEQKG